MNELKETIDELASVFHEFKKTNDTRLKAVEEGGAVGDLEGKLVAINEKMSELTDVKTKLEALETKSNRIPGGGQEDGEKAANVAAHVKGFNQYFRKGTIDGLRELEQKALSVGTDPSGGYTVHAEIEKSIDRIMGDFGAMRSLCTVMPITTSEYKRFVCLGGATSGWVGETQSRSETDTPALAELAFNVKELYSEPKTTQELLDDSIANIADWLADEVGVEFAEQEGDKFLTGNGVKQPRGLLTYPVVDNDSWSWGKIGSVNSGAAGAFAVAPNGGDALIDLTHALKRGYRANASWLMNDLTLAEVRKLKDSNGAYLWRPGIEAGAPETLLGKPIEIDDFMPDVAANSLSIAFGDFKRAYRIVDRVGVRVLRDDLTEKGFVKFYTTKRVGGGINHYEAVKFMKFAV
jgi:HK97 family phage major capsid protein